MEATQQTLEKAVLEKMAFRQQQGAGLDMSRIEWLDRTAQPYRELMAYYRCALMEVETKFNVLNQEFSVQYDRNPIESIKSRIKEPSSILAKMVTRQYPLTLESLEENLCDVAGIRVVCSFIEDIYMLADCLEKQDDITLVTRKDYIKNPKESGYKSYHMLVSVPIFLSDSVVDTKVEIQIRTIAMDFWASLEHKIYYKFEGNAPDYISRDLRECAKMVSELDEKMLQLNEAIQECILKESDRERLEGVCRDVIGSREEQKLMSAESAAEDPKKEDQKG